MYKLYIYIYIIIYLYLGSKISSLRDFDLLVKSVSNLLIDNTPESRQASKACAWFLVHYGKNNYYYIY